MGTGIIHFSFSLEEKRQQKLFMMEEPGFSEMCGMECKAFYLILFSSLYALILQAVVSSSDLKQDYSLWVFFMFFVLVEIEGSCHSLSH